MPRKSKVAFGNRDQTGWWIYNEVEQWVSDRQKKLTDRSRCLVWENTRLIQAKNRHQAYAKAMKLSQQGHPSRTNAGEWRFVGISMLLPVNEDLEDGAEILWTVRGKLSVAKIRSLVKDKKRLPVFDDTGRPK